MTKLFNTKLPIYPILLSLSLIFYNTDYNKRYDELNKYFDYNEFSLYLLFAIPLIIFKSKIFYTISMINKRYTENEIKGLLERYKINDSQLLKTQKFVNLASDLEEDGINMISHELYKECNISTNSRYVSPVLNRIRPDILSNSLSFLKMNLNEDKIKEIITQIQSDLKSN